jgi:lycopene beta-cyclase
VLPENHAFDYAFLGMGCANSLLVMALHKRGLLNSAQILVLEPAQKVRNDRTFCFWLSPEELKQVGLEKLISHSWDRVSCNGQPAQALNDKKYYYLRAEVLFEHVQNLLMEVGATWRHEVFNGEPQHLAKHVYDSRPPHWEALAKDQELIHQSFFGWLIRAKEPIFDPSTFTMMDFNIEQQGQTQFMYVLPFDAHTALLEPTRFSPDKLCQTNATALLDSYLAPHQTTFEILETEQGCIPMCAANFDLPQVHSNVLPTGANAGKLKPSTGYSFVRNLRDVNQIADSLVLNKTFHRKKASARFVFYDRLLLEILHRRPHAGKEIFGRLFARNKAVDVMAFLDEETNVWQEVKLMSSLPILLFLAAALRFLWRSLKALLRPSAVALGTGALLLILSKFGILEWFIPFWILGLLLVGIPHGALDHLHVLKELSFTKLVVYVFKYLFLGSLMYFSWSVSAPLALSLFLAYSAWHFGEADLKLWTPKAKWPAIIIWGFYVLFTLLLSHFTELVAILQSMQIEFPNSYISAMNTYSLEFTYSAVSVGLLFLWRFPLKGVFCSLVLLLIAAQLPLLAAFGLYFIFQHSVNGWQQLRLSHEMTNTRLWIHALPFTLGSFLLLGVLYYLDIPVNWGQAFIFLSALSFPHVLLMHRIYK